VIACVVGADVVSVDVVVGSVVDVVGSGSVVVVVGAVVVVVSGLVVGGGSWASVVKVTVRVGELVPS